MGSHGMWDDLQNRFAEWMRCPIALWTCALIAIDECSSQLWSEKLVCNGWYLLQRFITGQSAENKWLSSAQPEVGHLHHPSKAQRALMKRRQARLWLCFLGMACCTDELTVAVVICTRLAHQHFIVYGEEAHEVPPAFKEHRGQVESYSQQCGHWEVGLAQINNSHSCSCK